MIPDELTGEYRVSSKAFGPSSSDGTLSGDLEQILVEDGLDATAMYPAVRDPVGAASVTLAEILATGARVAHDPMQVNWYHGAVTGTKPKGVRARLRDKAVEIIPIDQARAKAFHDRAILYGNTHQ